MVEHVVIISRDDYEKIRKLLKDTLNDVDSAEPYAIELAKGRIESALRKLKGAK